MKRVTGLGGIFFKCEDQDNVRDWYNTHLGINNPHGYGAFFEWRQALDPDKKGFTNFSAFKKDSDYMAPSKHDYMVNFRVENLEELLKVLKAEGVEVVGEMQVEDYGKFAWIMDPEGRKIELWEPNDEVYDKMGKDLGQETIK